MLILIYSYYKPKKPIKVAIYLYCIRYGGMERVTALLLNLFSKQKNFAPYLITYTDRLEGEYELPNNVKRISIQGKKIDIFKAIRKEHIDILIYDYEIAHGMEKLNKLKYVK